MTKAPTWKLLDDGFIAIEREARWKPLGLPTGAGRDQKICSVAFTDMLEGRLFQIEWALEGERLRNAFPADELAHLRTVPEGELQVSPVPPFCYRLSGPRLFGYGRHASALEIAAIMAAARPWIRRGSDLLSLPKLQLRELAPEVDQLITVGLASPPVERVRFWRDQLIAHRMGAHHQVQLEGRALSWSSPGTDTLNHLADVLEMTCRVLLAIREWQAREAG